MSLKTKSRHSRLNTNNYPKKSVPAKCPRLPRFNSVRAPPASSNSTCLKQTDEKEEEEEEEEPTSIFAQAQPTNQRSDKTTLCLDARAERACNFYIRESEVRKNHHQFHHEVTTPLTNAGLGGFGGGGTEEGQQEGRRAGRGQGRIQPLHVRNLKI